MLQKDLHADPDQDEGHSPGGVLPAVPLLLSAPHPLVHHLPADEPQKHEGEPVVVRLHPPLDGHPGEKPDLEKEIARIDGQLGKTRGAIDRYFEAFEAGTLKAELCNEKVAGLRARLKEMEAEREGLEARRERLELPAIDREMLASLVDNFENVMAEGPQPKKEAPSPPAGEEGAYP